MATYNHAEIEAKWSARWAETGIYETDVRTATRPFYNLLMFPYPSAEGLHIGNMFAFTGVDIFGRLKAMQGEDVFEPIGFDAFGMHSENFALKQNVHPSELVPNNIRNFRQQLKSMGGRFAWSHEVDTTHPTYYRWTQWIFVQLFKHGLAEKRLAPVTWCPSCMTVLADEQVINGECERCSTEVTHRDLEQWFFKITDFADRLLSNLDEIDWTPLIKTAQRNWIGRSEGLETAFPVENSSESITFFTTRPDTIYGVTFMVLAPEHPLVDQIATSEQREVVVQYVAEAMKKTAIDRQSMERSGVFTGAFATNPLNGDRVPIWVGDYVLSTVGTGAIMAVPAHDTRDFDFAKRFDLPIRVVVAPPDWHGAALEDAYTESGTVVNSGEFDGMENEAAAAAVIEKLEKDGAGSRQVRFRLRDWLISRQRYWGTPIPIIHCKTCGPIAVPESDLPVELPYVEDFRPTGTDQSPLASLPEFVNVDCPECGKPARRETDVCDNFLDSAWYFFRYPSTGNDEAPFEPELTKRWLPVHNYIGGKEHAVLHLLYTRFITMALHEMGFIDFEEPFRKFRAHGLLILEGAKMSKSRGNVVNPDTYIASHGADTLRTYLMFSGRYEEGGDFSDSGIEGVARFLQRVRDVCERFVAQAGDGEPMSQEAQQTMHRAIKKVGADIEELKFNTAIAALMEYSHELQKRPSLNKDEVSIFLKLLAPFAPFVTEELWEQIGQPYSIHNSAWPIADETLAKLQEVSIAVQIDGRTRDVIEIEAGSGEDAAVAAAKASKKVQRHLEDGAIVKTIYVPDRMVNFVTSGKK